MCLCLQSSISELLRITRGLRDLQEILASGLQSGRYNRTDAARQRSQHRQLTKDLLAWTTRLQNFEGQPEFARQAIVTEVATASQDVDEVVGQGNTIGVLNEVIALLAEAETEANQPLIAPAPSAVEPAVDLRSCAVAAAAAGPTIYLSGTEPAPNRRRRFCLSIGSVKARPPKKKQKPSPPTPPRGKQGTPHPRADAAIQAAIDSADEYSEEEVEGLPYERLLSPPAGAVDYGPRTDGEKDCGYDGEEESTEDSDFDA